MRSFILQWVIIFLGAANGIEDDSISLIQKASWKGSSLSALRPDYEIMDWHIKGMSDLQYNNLGGLGPNKNDPAEIRYRNVSKLASGQELDLVVTSIDAYWSHNKISQNGVVYEFGKIVVKRKKANRFKFRFVETQTYNLAKIRAFDFTILDMDQDSVNSYCMEMIAVWGATGYYTVPDAYSAIGITAPHWEDHESGITVCSNVTWGDGKAADPKSVKTLSHAQARAAVLFTFENTSEFQVGFANTKLRGFQFAGTANPLRWPTGVWHEHFQPIVADELMEGHGRVFHWNLDQEATVTANNLGGRGPNFDDAKEIRYANVGTLKTHDNNEVVISEMKLDLVAFTESQYWGSDFINNNWNGANGEYGEIGLSRRSEATIMFTFVEHGTNIPKIVPFFDFTVFDIDNMADPSLGEEYSVFGASEYAMVDDSYTIVDESVPGCVKLTSNVTISSGAIPNPTSWADLTEDQTKVAVQFRYYDTARWSVHFKTTTTTERAFLFGGQSRPPLTELGTTRQIASAAPTAFPMQSPTGSPSFSPTASPSASPSASPTGSPSLSPTASPSASPTGSPSLSPTASPSASPTGSPSLSPTASPSASPTGSPSLSPTASPSASPTGSPSLSPTASPSPSPTGSPSLSPTESPSVSPTGSPSLSPTAAPSASPTGSPTLSPTESPSESPTGSPSLSPTASPSASPTGSPSMSPTASPSASPTGSPSLSPTARPSASPFGAPQPIEAPPPSSTGSPSLAPTARPSASPFGAPQPIEAPPPSSTGSPSLAPTGTSTVFGDPHVMNQHGEVFDILRAGSHAFLVVPRGAEPGAELLLVRGQVTPRGELCAGQLYLTHLNITGGWLLGVERLELFTTGEEFNVPQSIGLKAGASGNLSTGDFAQAVPQKVAHITTFQPERPMQLNHHVTTLLVRLYLGPTILRISWEHQREKEGYSNSLMLLAYGLGRIPGEVGGLLGKDDHHWASGPPAQCIPRRQPEQLLGDAGSAHTLAARLAPCCVRAAALDSEDVE